MKRLTKILFVAGGSLLLTGGAVANYLAAQPETLQEELTLANLEAMAIVLNEDDKWEGVEMELDCNDFCTRDPNKACRVPITINGATLTYICDSWRK